MAHRAQTSPTSIDTDWRCRRERYLRDGFGGVGLEPVTIDEDLEIGKRMHAGLEAFFGIPASTASPLSIGEGRKDHPTSDRLATALDTIRREPFTDPWQTWMEASLMAWATRVWPELDKQYEIVLVEHMFQVDIYGVLYKVKPDLILRHRVDKSYWVYDFKTFRWWDNKRWQRAIQLQLGAWVAELELSKPDHRVEVAGTIIQGISKGQTRGDKLYHPLVYGYRREADPGITKAAYAYEYKRGFERFDVNAYPGGVRAWIDCAPADVIGDCFPQTAPIYLDRKMMVEFLGQRNKREMNIAYAYEMLEHGTKVPVLDEEFEQNFSACESDRRRCPMFEACHMETVRKDPVGSGLYRLRVREGKYD